MHKYFERYAEPGTAVAGEAPDDRRWGQAAVIPVCNESTGILRPLPEAPGRTLMIVVINQSCEAPGHVTEANQSFADEVSSRFRLDWRSAPQAGLALFADPASRRDLLLVDSFSEGRCMPPGGGVGHARKTGADIAAYLFSMGRIQSPWLHCTDGDVVLPQRYFPPVRTSMVRWPTKPPR